MIPITRSTDYKILKWKKLGNGEFIYLIELPTKNWAYVKHGADDSTIIDSRFCLNYADALHEFVKAKEDSF